MPPKVEQAPHQAEEYLRHRDDPHRALIWYVRTGKTEPVISTACYHHERFQLDGAVVVAPHDADAIAWAIDKVPKFAWDVSDAMSLFWESSAKGTRRQREDLDRLLRHPGLGFLIVIPEALLVPECQDALLAFLKANPRSMLIVDECHRFGRAGAKRTRKLRWLAPRFCMRRLLSGTPWHNSPLRAYSQYQILEPGCLGAETAAEFEGRYAEMEIKRTAGNKAYAVPIGYKNLDDLGERIGRVSSFVGRDEANLPELAQASIYCRMEAEDQIRQYRNLSKKGFYTLGGGPIIEVAGGLPRLSKLQQFASGFSYEPGDEIHDFYPRYWRGNPRAKALMDELGDAPGSVVIWCKFTREIEGLADMLGSGAFAYHGRMSKRERRENLEGFKRGERRWLIAQPAIAGEALDLSVADFVIWYSQTVDAIQREQASERASLGERPVRLTDIVGSSVCGYLVALNRRKISLAEELKRLGDQQLMEEIEEWHP